MGASLFVQSAKGADVNEVFDYLSQAATAEYGYDPYNGTISTTRLGREYKIPEQFKTKKAKLAHLDKNFDNLFPEKWVSRYSNLGVLYYNAFSPKWEENRETFGKKKGVTMKQRFGVINKKTLNMYSTYNTLGDAKKEAKQLCLKYGKEYIIVQYRSNGEYVRLGYMDLIPDKKEYKSARQSKTKIYKPIYEFIFFVYAAE